MSNGSGILCLNEMEQPASVKSLSGSICVISLAGDLERWGGTKEPGRQTGLAEAQQKVRDQRHIG